MKLPSFDTNSKDLAKDVVSRTHFAKQRYAKIVPGQQIQQEKRNWDHKLKQAETLPAHRELDLGEDYSNTTITPTPRKSLQLLLEEISSVSNTRGVRRPLRK